MHGGIDAVNVHRLHPIWRFRFRIQPRDSGVATATPLVDDGVVYVQDMESNVFALRAKDGKLLWSRYFDAGNPGPNGIALDGGTIYGSTDTTVFALDSRTGRVRWTHRVLLPSDSYLDVAPLAAHGIVYTGSTSYYIGTRGFIEALDERTGALKWRLDTVATDWPHPHASGGGGMWQTPTLSDGTLYAGTANPLPWGGSPAYPNGAAYGRALWTDTLLALDAKNGHVRWFDQVTPHDTRDHDFQNPPIVVGDRIYGAAKAGVALAWDRSTHRRLWTVRVGLHRNDRGPLPRRLVPVCPGVLGGVETPSSVAGGRMFLAVVDLCYRENSIGSAAHTYLSADPTKGHGEVVALSTATGRRVWSHLLRTPPFGCTTVSDDVVFVPTYDGWTTAYAASDGRVLWRARARAGINACPSVAGGRLFVAAGVPNRWFPHPRYELIAYGE